MMEAVQRRRKGRDEALRRKGREREQGKDLRNEEKEKDHWSYHMDHKKKEGMRQSWMIDRDRNQKKEM